MIILTGGSVPGTVHFEEDTVLIVDSVRAFFEILGLLAYLTMFTPFIVIATIGAVVIGGTASLVRR